MASARGLVREESENVGSPSIHYMIKHSDEAESADVFQWPQDFSVVMFLAGLQDRNGSSSIGKQRLTLP